MVRCVPHSAAALMCELATLLPVADEHDLEACQLTEGLFHSQIVRRELARVKQVG